MNSHGLTISPAVILSLALVGADVNLSHAQTHAQPKSDPTNTPEQTETPKWAVSIPNVFVSTDSENFSTYKYSAGVIPLYEHGEKYTGVSYQHNFFRQDGWNSSAEQVNLTTKAINPRTWLGYNVNVGYNVQNGYQLLTTDTNYALSLTDTTRAELLLNRDRVETQNALQNGIYYTFVGASLEQRLWDRLSVIALGGNMYFSDTNTRPTLRAKLVYDLIPEYGITAQIRYKQYRDTNIDLPNNYFNPESYRETMFALGFRKRYNGWVFSGTAGLGRQKINEDPQTTTQLYELAVTSPVASNDFYFKTRMGYGVSAGFLGPNYIYRYILQEMIIPF